MPVITGISGGGASNALVQFVDSISTTAVVRFDFHDLEPSMVTKIDLSPPPLRKAQSSTMLTDGERVNASAYGNRTIGITAEFVSDSEDAASAALSALAAELNRPTNILKVQVGSNATFFRTYRSTFSSQMLNHDTTYLENGVDIEAEPFGLGLPQIVPSLTLAGSTTTRIASDPAYTGSDMLPGRCMDINNVLGDVETPPQVVLIPTWTPIGADGPTVVAVRRRGNPAALTHVMQAENWSAGADTAISGSHDGNLSAAGNNYMRCTFASNTALVPRVRFGWPPGSTVEARGSFRLFARVRGNGGGVGLGLAATYGGVQLQPAVGVTPDGAIRTYDLGTFTAPQGADPVYDGFSGVELPITPADLSLVANRPSGSATLDFDYIIAVPADDHLAVVTFSTVATSTYPMLDSTTDTVYQSTTVLGDPSGLILSPATHSFSGSLPMLSPGANRLYVVGPVFDPVIGLGDDIVTHVDVQVRYWPRYLMLATA